MSDKLWNTWEVVLAMIVCLVCGMMIGGRIAQDEHRNAAIKAGAARWAVDAKTGRARFEYGRGE